MSSFKRIAAGASALALASGAVLAGAGIAGAQGSSEIAAGLELAASALNGPVTVAGNTTGGPTVTYTNETAAPQSCVGFTMPYTSVDELNINPSALNFADEVAVTAFFSALEGAGGVSVLGVADGGAPNAYEATAGNGGVLGALGPFQASGAGVVVAADASIEWTAPTPITPAAAVVICASGAAPVVSFGIDKQVVVDQINGTLPGGSIGAGSVSGGSVATGASLLGSLGGGDDAADDTGDLPSLGALV